VRALSELQFTIKRPLSGKMPLFGIANSHCWVRRRWNEGQVLNHRLDNGR
jgi:hypothetical protein